MSLFSPQRFPGARWALIMVAATLLAGCDTAPAGKPDLPADWLMQKPPACPVAPPNDGDPVVRSEYEARLKACAAERGDQVRGLQKYARTVSGAAR